MELEFVEINGNKFYGMLPHAAVVRLSNSDVCEILPTDIVIPRSGEICRVDSVVGDLHDIGLPFPVADPSRFLSPILYQIDDKNKPVPNTERQLPEPEEGVVYMVSGQAGSYLSDRPDVVMPGTDAKHNPVRYPQDWPDVSKRGQVFAVRVVVSAKPIKL